MTNAEFSRMSGGITPKTLRACLQISKLDRDDSPLPCQSPHFADKTEVKSFGRACFHGPNLNLKTPSKADASQFGVERAVALYGSLPEQLVDSHSFVVQLGRMLKARKKCHIAEGKLLAVPNCAIELLKIRVPDEPPQSPDFPVFGSVMSGG